MIIDLRNQNSGGGGEDPRVDQLIKKVNAISGDVAKKQDKLNNITEIPDEAIIVGKLNDEGQPIGGVVAVTEDGVVQIEASELIVAKDGESYIYATGEDVSLNGNVRVKGSTVLTEASVKTINGESIVGEGDIEIKGGGEKVTVYYQKSGGYNPSAITYDVGEVINFTTLLSASTYEYVTIENYTTDKLTFRTSSSSALTIKLLTIKGGKYTNFANSFEYKTKIESLVIDGEFIGGANVTRWQNANAEVVYYKQKQSSGSALLGKIRTVFDVPTATINKENKSVKSVGLEGSDADVILTNNVTVLYGAFYFCRGLTSVTLPNTITVIGMNAFYYCDSLTNITIPVSVTTIDKQAFSNCSSLKEITIPSSVKNIDNAFIYVPTEGTLYCDEDWFNSLTSTQKSNLGNVANWERKPIPTQLPLDERVDDLDERVTALEEGGGGGGSYLPLSGGTLNGNLTLGDTAETSYRKVESIRNTNSQANGAAFYVNSDGTSAFFHKAYNGASATNDAILKFDATSLQFAKGGSRGTTASDFKKVILEDMFTYDPSTKTLDINFI